MGEMTDDEIIMLLKLNRIPSFIRRDLAVATSLAQCRNALIDAGHLWKTIEGAYIFVHPHQYRQAMAATRVLRPDNIIVSASIEHLVAEVLQNTGICARTREIIVPATISSMQRAVQSEEPQTNDERRYCLTVKRTFFCAIREQHEVVTCSTSDARPGWIN